MRKVFYKGYWYKSDTNESLIIRLRKAYPNVTKEFLKELVETKGVDYNKGKTKKDGIKFSQLVAGASALVNVTKGSVVSQAEINRRAKICTNCKTNDSETGNLVDGVVPVSDCRACGFAGRFANWSNKLKRQFGGGYIIPNNLADKGCIICKCSLSVMLPSKMSAFEYEKDAQDQRPDHCWVKKTSNNYISQL